MKPLIAILFTLCVGLAFADEPCAIRHCPAGTSCRPAPAPCAPCPVAATVPPTKGGQDEPVPVPPKPEIRLVPVRVEVPGPERVVTRLVPDQRHGLVMPLSLFKVGSTNGIAAGLGYQFRNRMILSGQAVLANQAEVSSLSYFSQNTTSFSDHPLPAPLPRHCTDGHGHDNDHNPHCQPGGDDDVPPPVSRNRSYSSSSTDHDTHVGAMVTLTIPLGR